MVTGERQSEVEAAVNGFNARLLRAINESDLAAIEQLTYDRYITMGDGRAATMGKDANLAVYRMSAEIIRVEEQWFPEETLVDGDVAYQTGKLFVKVARKDGSVSGETSARYLNVYREQADGSWILTLNQFTSEENGDIWDKIFS